MSGRMEAVREGAAVMIQIKHPTVQLMQDWV